MFVEKLRIIIDTVTDKATAGMRGFRQSVAEAEGITGKMRAGVGSLGSTFGSFIKSPLGAATAITAVGGAMFKAVGQAQELALSVGKLAAATGLSTEQASRWVEVANDMGISTQQVEGLIGKLSVSLGKTPEAFAKLGVETQTAKDGTVDMNATLLDAIGVLNGIKDPTERAALAQKLFGKSWKDAAELIGAGADSVKAKLDAVQDAKIIDPKQVEQAREYRDAMADLADVGEDLTISLGKSLVPILTSVAQGLTIVANASGKADDALGKATSNSWSLNDALATLATAGLYGVGKGVAQLADDGNILTDQLGTLKDAVGFVDVAAVSATTQLDQLGDANKETAQAAYELTVQERALNEEIRIAAARLEAATRAHNDFLAALDEDEAIARTTELLSTANEELAATGAVSDETARALVRAFDASTTLQTGLNTLADKQFKVAVDTGDLSAALTIMQNIQAAAAAGATFNVVTQNYEGGTADTFERRSQLAGKGAR